MTQDNPLLTELNLFRPKVAQLHAEGFERLDDLRPLSNAEICRMINGRGLNRLFEALGRERRHGVIRRKK